MNVHHASLFRYKEYQSDIHWLVEQVDHRNYEPLRERACRASRRFQHEWPLSQLGWVHIKDGVEEEILTQEWPLLEHGGGGLPSETEIKSCLEPSSRDIGYYFLIILGEYIEKCPTPLGNWSVLRDALGIIGWNRQDCDLLFRGLPTSTLLKPKTGKQSPWPLKDTDPYWLWLHPGGARAGWLSMDEVTQFDIRLRSLAEEVKAFDLQKLPNIRVDNPIVIRDYYGYLNDAYRDALAMLETAQKSGQGLFMSISTM